jgi:hypothetical protein
MGGTMTPFHVMILDEVHMAAAEGHTVESTIGMREALNWWRNTTQGTHLQRLEDLLSARVKALCSLVHADDSSTLG